VKEISSSNKPWNVLQVRDRFEKVVAMHLHSKGYQMCLPFCHRCRLDRTQQGDIPLFPGYIFCKFDAKDRLRLFMIPGVTAVMSFGEKPLAIPENEICALQNIIDSGLHYEPWLFLNVGQPARIKSGPLKGLDGILVEGRKNRRFIVPISLLRRSVAVEIEKASLLS
jgi:transcription termination/antitermination protein NusG